ncbi:hypothetical protein BCR44DRAFT_1074998 [Catenaria anguillulae PL171]|uniref:Protection of telomeres protein 1 ssDNA-binding domain-containing protein n=1 Tax=Catenaria anguillulae PL171 TaxID=765915 RepID=A0A1Y2HP81_9FUNG|nr:hypothetical protein BCR44DRAFT_1074998 [Catenaria anguillulae PL171]
MAAPNPTTWALTSLAPPPPPPPPPRAPAHPLLQPPAKPNSDSSSLATTTMDLEYTPLAAIPSLRQYTKVNILAVVQVESNTIPTLNRKGHAQIKLCLRDSSLPRSAPYTTLMLFRHQPQDFARAAQLLVEGSIVRIKSATVTCTPTNTHSMLIVGSNDYVSMSVTMGSSSPEIEARPVGIKGVTPLLLCGAGDQAKVNALREWWWSQTHAANLAGFSQIGMTQVVMPPPRPVFRPPAAHQYAAPPPPAAAAAASSSSSSSSSSSASIAQARPIHPSIATTQTNCFYDLIVEIVQVKGFPGDTFMTALVTDYSAKSIAEIGTFQHTFGANAPVVHDHQGVLLDPHTLIPMLLFDEHKHFAETHCSAGTLVLVRNCRAAKAVSGSMERFELKMQGSRGNKQCSAGLPRMEVVSREDERCRPLMQRRSRMLETQNMPVVAEQLMDKLEAEGMPEIGTEGVEAKRRRIGALMVSNANAAAESVIRPVPVSFTCARLHVSILFARP